MRMKGSDCMDGKIAKRTDDVLVHFAIM